MFDDGQGRLKKLSDAIAEQYAYELKPFESVDLSGRGLFGELAKAPVR